MVEPELLTRLIASLEGACFDFEDTDYVYFDWPLCGLLLALQGNARIVGRQDRLVSFTFLPIHYPPVMYHSTTVHIYFSVSLRYNSDRFSIVLQSTLIQHLNSIRSFLFCYLFLSSYWPSSGRKDRMKSATEETHTRMMILQLTTPWLKSCRRQSGESYSELEAITFRILILCWYAIVENQMQEVRNFLPNWSLALRWQTCVLFECNLTVEIFIAPYGSRGKSGSTHQNYKMWLSLNAVCPSTFIKTSFSSCSCIRKSTLLRTRTLAGVLCYNLNRVFGQL